MRFRPDARPDQLPPPERRIHTVFNGAAHCVSPPRPRPTETTKHGVPAETSRRCLSPGGGLFFMRFRPNARPDLLPPPERRIHTVFNGTAHCVSPKAPLDLDHETRHAGRDLSSEPKSGRGSFLHEV